MGIIPNTIFIVLVSLGGISRLFGLCLLIKVKGIPQNQRLLLANLSATELVLNLFLLVKQCLALNNMQKIFPDTIEVIFKVFLYTNLRLAVIHIITDRFLEIRLNIKYALYVTYKRFKAILISTLLLSVVFTMAMTIHYTLQRNSYFVFQILNRTLLVLDTLILILATATYVYFFLIVLKFNGPIHPHSGGSNSTSETVKISVRKFKVPFLVILSFILFNFTSTIVFVILREVENSEQLSSILVDVGELLDIIGFLSDSCIYILFQKQIWSHCQDWILKKERTTSTSSMIQSNL